MIDKSSLQVQGLESGATDVLRQLAVNPSASLPDAVLQGVTDEVKRVAARDAKILGLINTVLRRPTRGITTGPVAPELEQLKVNPEPSELNLQLALTRLVLSEDEQQRARQDGAAFQLKYNLTNDQMWTLCRIAIEVGIFENTADLQNVLVAIKDLDPTLLALSPDALKRLNIDPSLVLVGSCSCCCP